MSTTSDIARWQRVEAALGAALEASPAERPGLLKRLCGDDAELLREVESLLAAHARAGSYLETTAAAFVLDRLVDAPSLPTDSPGAIVDRYRLVEEIGRGGMGTVWLAERADGHFEHRVALKLVKRGMDTDEILARFLRERQILARLEHPHIARLLDGGVTADGRPYFVMEHVAGEPLTEYCDRRRLPIEQRLQLFVAICRAIEHAHRNLVVHRDIKPTNVLVTEAGEVKLLDFGIARLLSDEDGPATRSAGAAGGVMTPEYASPEQVAGEPITTMSDVYQLGVLLYELLCGRLPHAAAGRASSMVLREIRETMPARPSTAVRRETTLRHRDGTAETIGPEGVSVRRATSPERLRRRLRGDLDTIAMRALRKEPERRYPSVEALAEDVDRHLACLPLRSSGDRLTYRTSRFIRRHRFRVATAAVLVAVVAAGLALYTLNIRRERDRARMEAAKAAESAELMRSVFDGWDPDAADRGEVDATAVLRTAVQAAESNLQRQPEMLAASLSILGELFTSLEAMQTADSLFLRALTIQEGRDSMSLDTAATLARRGRMLSGFSGAEEGGRALQRSWELHRRHLGGGDMETLRVERDLAENLRLQSDFAPAERHLRNILGTLREDDEHPSPFALGVATDLGYILFLQGRYDESIPILRLARDRQRRMFGPLYGPSVLTTRFLASALRDRGELEEAEVLYRDALRTSRALYGEDHRQTAGAVVVLSILLERKGDLEEAERLARHDIDFWAAIMGARSGVVGQETVRLGGIRLDRGDTAEGERLLRLGLEIMRAEFPAGHPDEGDGLNRLAYVLILRGAPDREPAYREAVAFHRARPAGSPVFVSDGIHFLAWSEHEMGDLTAAEADYRIALGLYRRQLPAGHPYRAAAATGLGAVLLDAGRPSEAARYLREGRDQWSRSSDPDPDRLAELRSLLDRAHEPR